MSRACPRPKQRPRFPRSNAASESPLPRTDGNGNKDAGFYYVVTAPGTYAVSIRNAFDATGEHSTGKYTMELVLARPALEQQPVGTKQIVFVDFDGATTKGYDAKRRLSPLSSFLAGWGLTAADENAVIDTVLATIHENFSEVRNLGLNGDFAATQNPGDFDIEIRNSRDHVDEFGINPFVSRLVIGGTTREFGYPPSGRTSWGRADHRRRELQNG